MQGLTPRQITAWLDSHGQIEDPYLGDFEPPFRVQCYAPSTYFATEYFLRGVLSLIIMEGDLVIQATDWSPTEECRDFVFRTMQREANELRPMVEAPGFLIPRLEEERAIAVFAFTVCFKWKSYLYGAMDQTTLYNWEGDIFDFWTSSEIKRDQFLNLMLQFKLDEIRDEPNIK